MKHVNVEIKARCKSLDRARAILRGCGAVDKGVDHQIDTYFATASGRLKLREGKIENSLIHYERSDGERLKLSRVTRCDTRGVGAELKDVLSKALSVIATVDKRREIYFVKNVKFHLDRVAGLGTFLEIEAIDLDGTRGLTALRRQCDKFMALLGVVDSDLLLCSYSDMIMRERHKDPDSHLEAAA